MNLFTHRRRLRKLNSARRDDARGNGLGGKSLLDLVRCFFRYRRAVVSGAVFVFRAPAVGGSKNETTANAEAQCLRQKPRLQSKRTIIFPSSN